MANKPLVGSISWTDLTVEDARAIRDFYEHVAGWKHGEVPMGEYADFTMHRPSDGTVVAGVCHKRGFNSALPSQWIIYITVADLNNSIEECQRRGGAVLAGPTRMGETAQYCIIRDPAGAVAGLYEDRA